MKKQAPFTLIELLVVVAIIAILASLLLPALSSARGRAMSTSCTNTLKQLSMTNLNYADEFDQRLPELRRNVAYPRNYWWTYDIALYAYPGVGFKTSADNVFNINGGQVKGVEFGLRSMLTCPSRQSRIVTPSYGRNFYLWNGPGTGNVWFASPHLTKCTDPTQTVFFGDSKVFHSAGWDNANPHIHDTNLPTDAHVNETLNLSWVDGHVTSVKYYAYANPPYNYGGSDDVWTMVR